MKTLGKNWTSEIKEVTGRKGKTLFMPLRKALTGMEHGQICQNYYHCFKK